MAAQRQGRRRAVTPTQLENRERDLQVDDRGPTSPPAPEGTEDTSGELDELRARIESARKLKSKGEGLHCFDCWKKGRDAAIRHIEGIGQG